ncbi:reverse transcriptase domain-containing protein [Tanacetum coccineum]
MCPNPYPAGLFADPTGSVTLFVRWIEDYPFPDGLKMPSHVGSYDGNGDPDNFLHLFEGAIRMQKWLMLVACHMFTYTLKDSVRIWWNSQKAGSILIYEYLKAKFRAHFRQQKRFTKTHLAVHSIKQREGDSVRAFATRYTDDTLQILGLHEDQRIYGFVHGLRTRNLIEHLSTDLPFTYKGLMKKPTHGLKQEKLPLMGPQRIGGITLKGQGSPPGTTARDIKVETGEWKEEKRSAKPVETLVLMINRRSCNPRKRYVEEDYNKVGKITFPPLSDKSLADPVIIKAYVLGRQIPSSRLEDLTRWLLWGILLALGRSTLGNQNWRRPPHSYKNAQLRHREI